MSAPVGNQSRKLAAALRELVASHLTAEGFEGVTATPPYTRLSEGIDLIGTPDVTGLDGVWIDVAARGSHRLSSDLDAAREDATAAGFGTTVLIAHRPGREIGQAYAVLTLQDFSRLARAAQPSL